MNSHISYVDKYNALNIALKYRVEEWNWLHWKLIQKQRTEDCEDIWGKNIEEKAHENFWSGACLVHLST